MQLAFLTLSGISYTYKNDGSLRSSAAFSQLAFAADVTPPTNNRILTIIGGVAVPPSVGTNTSAGFTGSNTTNNLSYKTLVQAVTYAKTQYIKGLMQGGKEYYVLFVRPEAIAQLKQDEFLQRALITGMPRGTDNPVFTGALVTVDGLIIHEHRLVFNTLGASATTNSKWGPTGTVDGSRALLCGAQALGFADLGTPEWAEKWFNYDSSPGINVDKMFGFLKPKFYSIYSQTVEDFGVLCIDHMI